MPDVDDKFKSRVTFTLLAITAIALAIGLVWIGRVIFLLLFAAIIGALFLGEKLTPRRLCAAALIAAGAIVLGWHR